VLPYRSLSRAETRTLTAAVDHYARFMNLATQLVVI
jgi:hypothetical protein